jgi:hypothetical protein
LTPEHRKRWELEIRRQRCPFKKPADLIRRAAASEDIVDSAVIGGVSVADILAGKIAESQIPSNVISAFQGQFPNYGSSLDRPSIILQATQKGWQVLSTV